MLKLEETMSIWGWLTGEHDRKVIHIYKTIKDNFLWVAFVNGHAIAEGSIRGFQTFDEAESSAKSILKGKWDTKAVSE